MASQKTNDDDIDNLPDDASSYYGRDGSGRGGSSVLDRTMTGTSSRSDHNDHPHLHHQDSSYDIAKKETQLVIKQRLLVGALLFVAGAAISLVVYLTTSRSQQNEFRAVFEGGADKILSTFNDIVREKVNEPISLCNNVPTPVLCVCSLAATTGFDSFPSFFWLSDLALLFSPVSFSKPFFIRSARSVRSVSP
jgi:hypothetical protein